MDNNAKSELENIRRDIDELDTALVALLDEAGCPHTVDFHTSSSMGGLAV